MGGACSTDWSDTKCAQYFGWKTLREENSAHLCVHGKIISEWIIGK